MTTTSTTSVNAEVLIKRYKDAYTVASVIIRFGTALKFLGYFIGAVVFLATFAKIDSTSTRGSHAPVEACVAGVVLGVIFWLVPYVLGIIASCQGQVLRANLDEAVYVCPFFTDANKIIAAGLPTIRNA